MRERPILMNGAMVRATLAGTKTQTRRIITPQPEMVTDKRIEPWQGDPSALLALLKQNGRNCPYGAPGDRLWVRETHAQVFDVDIPAGRPVGPIGTGGSPARPDWKSRYVYLADGAMPAVQWHHVGDSQPVRWTPSIHMPRAASRILLEIASVRVERLQDISESDAIAEGIEKTPQGFWSLYGQHDTNGTFNPRTSFRALWQSIDGTENWDANSWVWVIEFKRISTGGCQKN